MRALIQQNIRAGLGDLTTNIIYSFNIAEQLKIFNCTYVTLYINLSTDFFYFNKDTFFDFYNLNEFKKVFDEIIVSENPILTREYNSMHYHFVNGKNELSSNPIDLFLQIDNSAYENIIDNFGKVYLINIKNKIRNLLNYKIIENYKLKNKNKNYVSIHYRTWDSHDNEETFELNRIKLCEILDNNELVYVCSTSYKFKEYIKSLGKINYFIFTIPDEEKFGSHMVHRKDYDNTDLMTKRTEMAFIEMLTLSESNEIFTFNAFNATSNFLLFALQKGIKITIYPLKS